MTTKILWKGALIGTLALPLAAFANGSSGTLDQSGSVNTPSDTRPSDPMNPTDPTGIQSDTSKTDKGAMKDTASTKEITGTISKVGSKELWLNSEDGQKMTLNVDSTTKVYKPTGATQKITELKEGQQVRASYDTKKDKMHALRIDVVEGTGMKHDMDKGMDKTNEGMDKTKDLGTPTTP